jgi:hypothetical protein
VNYKRLVILLFFALIFSWSGVSSGAPGVESLLQEEVPEGWTLMDSPRTYTRRTLFEHINGQAELFFKYGFQKSVFAIYQGPKNQENQIELDIYDMGNVLQAFGIFSRFRGEERIMGIGLDSYLDDQSALFYKGKYFVMLYSTESNPSILRQFSMAVSLKIADHSPPPKEIGYFPPKELQPGSIQYFPEGLLGYQFLKRGFQGTYLEKAEAEDKGKLKPEGKEFHLFLAIFKNSQEAMSALKAYRDDLSKKGKSSLGSLIQFGTRALKGEDPYHGRVIVLQKGFYLLSVVGFEKEKYAENLLTEFMRNIR